MAKNMIIILAIVAVSAVVMTRAAPKPEKYTTKYDNVNIDEILHNDRLLDSYFKCLVGAGKCTPEGEEIKNVGVTVLNAAFANTFQHMPPELMTTITEMQGVINQAYKTEAEKLTQNK